MKRLPLLLTLFLLSSYFYVSGQTKITGEVVDESDQTTKLSNATIMLLQAKDSILVDFTRANENGKFSLTKPDTADYLVMVSYPKFGDHVRKITDSGDADLGKIALTSVANLIEEVMVTGKIPVVIKGDTVEYDASSFATEKNAKVEDLLKVLPGMTVDENGKITAQGKTVEKVLVDGEEFFGDDPTLVTRNIRSDMVDKVQLYEKKSEEAERTGVDDGERIQTLNVTLKEDAKKGMFGKAEAAGGTDEYYLGKLALNKFKGSQKIGLYAIGANDGTVGLDWQESEKFGMSQMEMTDDGGIFIMGGSGFDYWDGKGRPKAFNSGISLTDAWKENKHKLNASYKFGVIQNAIEEGNISQNNLVNGQINSSNNSQQESDNRKHRLNARYDLKMDSLTTLTVKVSADKSRLEVDQFTDASTADENFDLMNSNERTQQSVSDNSNFTYDGYLTRKFRKKGRSLSLRIAGNVADNDSEGYLYSVENYYRNDSTAITDQLKDNSSKSNNLRSSVTYTEPITKKLNASLGYEFNQAKAQSVNNSFNNDGAGNYNQLDEEFSNDFDFNTIRNAANLSFNYKLEKVDINLTNNFRNDNLFQRNNYEALELSRDFFTYNPSLRMSYNITKNKRLNFNYNHTNTLPQLSQIQPLRQNIDPLNIVVGNESLTPARNDNFSVYFNNYNMLKGKYMYASVSLRQVRNSIQQNVEIDEETGVRTSFFDNLDGYVSNNVSLWGGGGFPVIKNVKIDGGYGINGSYGNYYNFINGELNENTNYDYSVNFSLRKNTTKNVDFNVNLRPGWRTMRTSLQPEYNSSGFTYNTSVWYRWHLPLSIAFYGDLTYSYEAPTKAFDEKFERVQFKPGISKKFLKDESLMVDFYVNDIFNQNVGFRRYQSGNVITQNTYNTISRYFMLKVTWDFTTMKGGSN